MTLIQSTYFTPAAPVVVLGSGRKPWTITVPGATLICSPDSSPFQATDALKLLKGFRATGRRLVWLDATELSATPGCALDAWGEKIVEFGGAQALIVTGPGGGKTVSAARRAGLLSTAATFAKDAPTARNLLCDVLAAGDVALLLGMGEEHSRAIVERLEYRSSRLTNGRQSG